MMLNRFVLLAVCLLLAAAGVSAQKKASDFSGKWVMDGDKSELGERARIQSMTLDVSQDDSTFTVDRRVEAGESSGMGRGPGRGLGGGGKQVYNLDGSESKGVAASPFGGETKLMARSGGDGSLVLTITREIESPMGAMSIKTVETWSLSDDGNVLTIKSETATPRGNRSQKLVFNRE